MGSWLGLQKGNTQDFASIVTIGSALDHSKEGEACKHGRRGLRPVRPAASGGAEGSGVGDARHGLRGCGALRPLACQTWPRPLCLPAAPLPHLARLLPARRCRPPPAPHLLPWSTGGVRGGLPAAMDACQGAAALRRLAAACGAGLLAVAPPLAARLH